MSKEISISDVKKHNNKKNLWIIIHNDVYDVSSFADEHPGGVESLLEFAGTDGTEAFEEVGHSKDARNILRKLKIGTLPMNERNKTILPCSKLKWAIVALAGAIVIGVVLKKYVAT